MVMNANIKKRMTPRQKCAITYPIIDSGEIPHARHHKRNGYVQSILTFDIAHVDSLGDADEEALARAIDGWFGVWHARASMHPVRLLKAWNKTATQDAKGVLLRCLSGVGLAGQVEVHNGSDLKSIHVYKWATRDELRLAEQELGSSFAEMKGARDED